MRLFFQDPERRHLVVSRDRVRRFRDVASAREFLRPLMADARNRAALRDLAAGTAGLLRSDDHDARDHFAERLAREDLVVVDWTEERVETVPAPPVEGTTPLEDEAAAQERAEPETEHFIEIELLDDDDEPVPDERYFIELPDGSTKSGRLDAEGKARVEGVDPGTAKVSFPDLDKERYEPK